MSKTIFIILLLFFPFISFSQNTYVPDDNFEQELINQGYDTVLDDYVLTANINTLTILNVAGESIADLTGIEDFSSLEQLFCDNNQLATINLSPLADLMYLDCDGNQLTTLDISLNLKLGGLTCAFNQIQSISLNDSLEILHCHNNQLDTLNFNNHEKIEIIGCENNNLTSLIVDSCINLDRLYCSGNQLSTLDVSTAIQLKNLYCNENQLSNLILNDSLEFLYCNDNQLLNIGLSGKIALEALYCLDNLLLTLDASSNPNLQHFYCSNNNLTSLDLRNGGNNFILKAKNNPDLNCINVSDTALANANWTVANNNIDSQHYFSLDCSVSAIEEPFTNNDKTLVKIVDILGKTVSPKQEGILFYIFSDGTIEKRIRVKN